jgi:transposase
MGRWTRDMARYGQKFKERVVARLLPPESSPVAAVSHTVGISVGTLERWRAEVLADPAGAGVRHWTPAARLEALIATAAMDQSARSTWCRELAASAKPARPKVWR